MVKKIDAAGFEQAMKDKIAVVDFSATWCGPCKMLAPVLEEISGEVADVSFYNVDVDENADIAGRFNIMSVPSVLLFHEGKLVDTMVGFVPKASILAFINKER